MFQIQHELSVSTIKINACQNKKKPRRAKTKEALLTNAWNREQDNEPYQQAHH